MGGWEKPKDLFFRAVRPDLPRARDVIQKKVAGTVQPTHQILWAQGETPLPPMETLDVVPPPPTTTPRPLTGLQLRLSTTTPPLDNCKFIPPPPPLPKSRDTREESYIVL